MNRIEIEGFIIWLVVVSVAVCLNPLTIIGVILLCTSWFVGSVTVGLILTVVGALGGIVGGSFFYGILSD